MDCIIDIADADRRISGPILKNILDGLRHGLSQSGGLFYAAHGDLRDPSINPANVTLTLDTHNLNYVDRRYTGMGGYSHGKGNVSIYIEPDNPNLLSPEVWDRSSRLAKHETHHAVRMLGPNYAPGKDITFGEWGVFEGLALCHEVDTGHQPHIAATFVNGQKLAAYCDRIRPHLQELAYDRKIEMSGSHNTPEYPFLAVYSWGFSMARPWLADNGLTAAAAVHVPSEVIVQAWLAKNYPNISEAEPNRDLIKGRGPALGGLDC